MHEKLKLDDFFCIWHRQSWKKDLERFRANNSKIPPPLPRFNVEHTNAIISLPKCPNIDWGGRGDVKSYLLYITFHLLHDICHHFTTLVIMLCIGIVCKSVPNLFFQDCLCQMQKKSSNFSFSIITQTLNMVSTSYRTRLESRPSALKWYQCCHIKIKIKTNSNIKAEQVGLEPTISCFLVCVLSRCAIDLIGIIHDRVVFNSIQRRYGQLGKGNCTVAHYLFIYMNYTHWEKPGYQHTGDKFINLCMYLFVYCY